MTRRRRDRTIPALERLDTASVVAKAPKAALEPAARALPQPLARPTYEDVAAATVAADREARTQLALRSIPAEFAWAHFGAPELRARVKTPEAIDEAVKAIGAARVALVGFAGSGKTSLACALLRSTIDAGREGDAVAHRLAVGARFFGAYWIAKARQEHRLGQGEAPLVEDAIAASVLVLDDVGIERAKNTAIEEVVYERHAAGRPTILTTGFEFRELQQRYGDGIARRMFEGATIIRCGGTKARHMEAIR